MLIVSGMHRLLGVAALLLFGVATMLFLSEASSLAVLLIYAAGVACAVAALASFDGKGWFGAGGDNGPWPFGPDGGDAGGSGGGDGGA